MGRGIICTLNLIPRFISIKNLIWPYWVFSSHFGFSSIQELTVTVDVKVILLWLDSFNQYDVLNHFWGTFLKLPKVSKGSRSGKDKKSLQVSKYLCSMHHSKLWGASCCIWPSQPNLLFVLFEFLTFYTCRFHIQRMGRFFWGFIWFITPFLALWSHVIYHYCCLIKTWTITMTNYWFQIHE